MKESHCTVKKSKNVNLGDKNHKLVLKRHKNVNLSQKSCNIV